MNGLAFAKNLASKKMGDFIENPKVLLIKRITEPNRAKNLISMNHIIQQENSFMELFFQKIKSLNVSLILCKKGLPQKFVDKLKDMNITAILNVKMKVLKLIARASRGKILSFTNEIPYESDFIGEFRNFYQETRGNIKFIHFSGLKDPSCVGTVFVSGPNQSELLSVKQILKTLILEYRNIRIEGSFLSVFQIKPLKNFFLDMHEKSAKFNHFVISENKLCKNPKILNIEFYDKNDLALGQFLIVTAEKIQQDCIDCKTP